MKGILGDLAFTVRSLLRRPAFVLLSVATLGVGIGAVTTVASVAEAVLLRELPLPRADRLAAVYSTNLPAGLARFSVSYPDFVDWTGRGDLFESASLYTEGDRDLSGDGDPRRLVVAAVHSRFFETLGSAAAVGRLLDDADQSPEAERTVVLSHGLWVREFGADAGVVGRTVRLDGSPHTVIGVASAGQGWPRGAMAWVPLRYGTNPPERVNRRSNHGWSVVARLRDGVDPAGASAQVRAMARAWYTANAAGNEKSVEAQVVPLRTSELPGDAAPLLAIAGISVLLVLLIACINQSNLLLVHAWGRTRELALRAALGAGRTRLAGLLLWESVLLALAGAALGLGLAALALGGMGSMTPEGAAGDIDARINAFVVLGAVGVALGSSLLAGFTPALRASRSTVAGTLGEGGARSGQGPSGARFRRSLVAVEVALSLVLLTGTGLTIRAFQGQLDADMGLDADGILVFNVRLPSARYGDRALADRYVDEAVDRLEAAPGVTVASATSSLPLGVARFNTRRVFLLEGEPEPPAGSDFSALWIEVDPEYFETLRVRPIRGRQFTTDDGSGAAPVILVNETLAERMAAGQDIMGRRIRSWRDEDLLREVVGIMPDMQLAGFAGRPEAAVFVPRAQGEASTLSFMVRIAGDPTAAVPTVRAVMGELDRDIALDDLRTLRDAHREQLAGLRVFTALFGVFGFVALLLAVSGVYGLVATSVTQRTREIGVRMALGGSTGGIRAEVVAEGVRLALLGIAAGTVLAFAFVKVLSSVVVGIAWLDPGTFVGVAAVLGSAVLVASWVPAVRASRIDPVEALRSE